MTTTCVIFDIDGTLVDSKSFEDRLYVAAVRSVLGNVNIHPDWRDYEHVTDSGIFRQICRANNFDFRKYEQYVRTHFGDLVSNHFRRVGPCQPIKGALAFFHQSLTDRKFAIGIATGGWGHTARMKLASAGYMTAGIPVTSADDDYQRIHIMAKCRAQLPSGDAVIYVGDGVWDQRAAEQLGWRFVGVGDALRNHCQDWIPDFSDVTLFDSL